MSIACTNGRCHTGVMLAHLETKRPPTYVWKLVVSVVRPNAKLLLFLLFLFSGKVKMYAQKIRSKARCVMKSVIITQPTKHPHWHYIPGRVFEVNNEGIDVWSNGKPTISTAALPPPVFDDFKKHPPKQSSFPYEDAIREVVKEVTKWLLSQISKIINNLIKYLKRRRRFRNKMKK
jgi:hypothetical protein